MVRKCARLRKRVALVVLGIYIRVRIRRHRLRQWHGGDLQVGRPPREQRGMAPRLTGTRAWRQMASAARGRPIIGRRRLLMHLEALLVVIVGIQIQIGHVGRWTERAQAAGIRTRRKALRNPTEPLCFAARSAPSSYAFPGCWATRTSTVDICAPEIVHVDDDRRVKAYAERLGRLVAALAHLV